MKSPVRLLWLLAALGGCSQEGMEGMEGPPPAEPAPDIAPLPTMVMPPLAMGPDLSRIVPWKAVNLIAPGELAWVEYDYRPRSQGGQREAIDATLERLKALGVRQVLIHALHAWSAEAAPQPDTGFRSTIYVRPGYRPEDPRTWGRVPRNRRGDMGLVPWFPPAAWDQPRPLAGPLELSARARQTIGEMLDAVAAHGLIPVLISEMHLVLAEDGNGYSPHVIFSDPSRDFDQFYRMYRDYAVEMTGVAASHGAAMFILGSETPYVAGAGQATFLDGSRMTDRRPLIAAKWREIIAAARSAAALAGRPDLVLSYAEINPFYDGRPLPGPRVPIWTLVPFWNDLDAVGVNFYQPGRWTDGNGKYDMGVKTADDMVAFGEEHSLALRNTVIPSMTDLRAYFRDELGYGLTNRPVYFAGDGCTASSLGAANPANPPFLKVGVPPDVTEQRNLYEAHFRLAERHGKGWLAGIGLWQVPPTGRWGGAWNPNDPSNYSQGAAYYNFLGTETEAVVRTYFNR